MNNTIVVPLNDSIIFTVLTTFFVFISVVSCALEIFLIIVTCCVNYPSVENNNQEQQQELQSLEPIQLRHMEDIEVSRDEEMQLPPEEQTNDKESLGKSKFKENVEFRFY